ncbi:glycosyltransferase [Microbacterium sp.]|uniref:glycosyltransferase n=1 Tax=Microbacterium sp. TaxID=51671 RepID=UPI0028122F0D|nr:glycosyltransferase [Microbacterium sp.]
MTRTGDGVVGRVLVWRWGWLAPSETFIRNQFDSYRLWEGVAVGAERVESVNSRPEDRVLFGDALADSARRELLKIFDWSPRLAKLVHTVDPDVMHAHFGGDASRVRRVAKRLGVPLVVTVHGADVTAQPRRSGLRGVRNRRRLRKVFRDAALVIAVSGFIREQAILWGADPERTIVHHIGVPVETLTAVEQKVWDVVFVGRLVAKKGVMDLLAAVDTSADALGREVRVAIVGDGPLREELEVRSRSNRASIEFLGRRSPADIRDILSRSRVFMGPSRQAANGDSEGFGMVFLEAAAAGLPVIAYRHGGVAEAVEDGVTGLLADEGHIDELTHHLVTVLQDRSLGERLGAAGRARVEAQFDVREQTRVLESIYAQVHSGLRAARKGRD